MRKIYYILANLLLLCSLSCCTLNKEDSSLLSGDVFPQTKKDWEAALNSVYEPLAGRSGGLFHGMLMGAMTTFPELATDVMDCYWNWDRFDKHQYNNSNMLWASETWIRSGNISSSPVLRHLSEGLNLLTAFPMR